MTDIARCIYIIGPHLIAGAALIVLAYCLMGGG